VLVALGLVALGLVASPSVNRVIAAITGFGGRRNRACVPDGCIGVVCSRAWSGALAGRPRVGPHLVLVHFVVVVVVNVSEYQ
jgi:hypothetical protein